MIKAFCSKVAGNLGMQMQANEDEIAVYAYGMEVFINNFIELGLLILLSLFLGIFEPAVLVLGAFMAFRIPGGGVHLSTYIRCLFFSLTVILCLAKISTVIILNPELLFALILLLSLLAFITIIKWVPGDTEKKPLRNPELIKKQKIKTAISFLLWLLLTFILILQGYYFYIQALFLGALGGLFLISPWGYRFINNLDDVLNMQK